MTAGDQVRRCAPQGTMLYKIVFRDSNGGMFTLPPGPEFYPISHNPPPLPAGTYEVMYFDVASVRIKTASPVMVTLSSGAQAAATQQLAMDISRAGATPSSPPPQQSPNQTAATSQAQMQGQSEEDVQGEAEEQEDAEDDPEGREEERYLKRQRQLLKMQMQANRHQQEITRSAVFTREIAEFQQLSSILRRDTAEARRELAEARREAERKHDRVVKGQYEDLERQREQLRRTMDLWEEVEERAVAKIAIPPPPPIDYTPLGMSALDLLGKIAVAVINKDKPVLITAPAALAALPAARDGEPQASTAGKPTSGANPSVSQSADGNKSTNNVVPFPASKTPAGASVLDKLGRKLASLGEADVIRRLASAGGWKQLMDELSAEIDSTETVE